MYTTLDGRTVTMDDLAGHVVLVAPDNPDFREALEALTDEFAERGFFAVFGDEVGDGGVGKPTLFSPKGEQIGQAEDPEEDTFVALLEEHLPV